jgi:hypothetical protein
MLRREAAFQVLHIAGLPSRLMASVGGNSPGPGSPVVVGEVPCGTCLRPQSDGDHDQQRSRLDDIARGYKKGELVDTLLRHFTLAFSADEPSAAQSKAKAWLPNAMLFPAIDPQAVQDEPEDEAIAA